MAAASALMSSYAVPVEEWIEFLKENNRYQKNIRTKEDALKYFTNIRKSIISDDKPIIKSMDERDRRLQETLTNGKDYIIYPDVTNIRHFYVIRYGYSPMSFGGVNYVDKYASFKLIYNKDNTINLFSDEDEREDLNPKKIDDIKREIKAATLKQFPASYQRGGVRRHSRKAKKNKARSLKIV